MLSHKQLARLYPQHINDCFRQFYLFAISNKYNLSDDAYLKQAFATTLIEKIFHKRSDDTKSNVKELIIERKIG